MTGKERAKLKALAQKKPTTIQLGKKEIGDTFFRQLRINLESEELVKIGILQSNDLTPKELFEILESEIEGLEFVSALGKKLTVYKRNEKNPKIEL